MSKHGTLLEEEHEHRKRKSPLGMGRNKMDLFELMIYCVCVCVCIHTYMGFPGDLDGKESACNVGDLSLIPGLVRSPGEGNDNPLQCSCLEKSTN